VDSLTAANQRIQQAFSDGSARFEWMHRRANGEDFPAEVLLTAFNLQGRRVLHASVRDIAERKQAEEEFQKSEARYRELVAGLPVGLYRNTPGACGGWVMANPAIAAMFGYGSPEEFMRCDVVDLYANPAERQQFSEKLLAAGEVRDAEMQLKRKDGSRLWASVSAKAMRNAQGEVEYFDGIIRDITKRKRAEEVLRDQEATLRAITEAASDAIVMMDAAGAVSFWNSAAERLFGWTKAEALGRNLHELLAPPAVPRCA
jgi:PAS domain S-box-containing protein